MEFTATITSISKSTEEGCICVTLETEKGVGIGLQVEKESEKEFSIGDTYTFTGVKN